jgi:hypothetical protein
MGGELEARVVNPRPCTRAGSRFITTKDPASQVSRSIDGPRMFAMSPITKCSGAS